MEEVIVASGRGNQLCGNCEVGMVRVEQGRMFSGERPAPATAAAANKIGAAVIQISTDYVLMALRILSRKISRIP